MSNRVVSLLRYYIKSFPEDALCVITVALVMPLFLTIHIVTSERLMGMVVFSISLGVYGMLIGYLIERMHSLLGFAIGVISFGIGMLSIGLIISTLRMESIMWWNVLTIIQGFWIILSWGCLTYLRSKWLSKSVAKGAFVTSICWLSLILITNFDLLQLMENFAVWKFIISYQSTPPNPTFLLWIGFWLWLLWLVHKWTDRHGMP